MQKNISTHFFYQNGKLVTLKAGEQDVSIFRTADMPLAEKPTKSSQPSGLLVTDDKGSVLQVQENT
ncbi:hypothetical protein [Pseudomonas sp. SID14000]|uniref:hypothetical protein n=1 Tax=Pseudomonas sp. SID14000 TaxID=1986221 RepID=UPI000B3D249A|nr:hypothetical protein [Pseudomonas sp. SID14000]